MAILRCIVCGGWQTFGGRTNDSIAEQCRPLQHPLINDCTLAACGWNMAVFIKNTPRSPSLEATSSQQQGINQANASANVYLWNETHDTKSTPVLGFTINEHIKRVACSNTTVLLLDVGGDVWKFDVSATVPQFKFPIILTRVDVYPPAITFPPRQRRRVTSIACGHLHTVLLVDNGDVLSFGLDAHGQLGHGESSTVEVKTPRVIQALLGLRVVGVAAGGWHSLVLTDTGDVYSFGRHDDGQLGRDIDELQTSPSLPGVIDFDNNADECIAMIAAGATHSCCVSTSGCVFVWGSNTFGQLGILPKTQHSHDSHDSHHIPTNVASLSPSTQSQLQPCTPSVNRPAVLIPAGVTNITNIFIGAASNTTLLELTVRR